MHNGPKYQGVHHNSEYKNSEWQVLFSFTETKSVSGSGDDVYLHRRDYIISNTTSLCVFITALSQYFTNFIFEWRNDTLFI